MLTEFSVRNFRNLESLSLDELGRITLIGGKNGVGKTALLEALWLFSGPDLPELSERINAFRGLPQLAPDDAFHDLFYDYQQKNRIVIKGDGDWEGDCSRRLGIYLQERETINTIRRGDMPVSQDSERNTRPQFESDWELVFEYRDGTGKTYTSSAWRVANSIGPMAPGLPELREEGLAQNRSLTLDRKNSVYIPSLHRENLQKTAERLGQIQVRGDDDRLMGILNHLEPRLHRLGVIQVRNAPVIHASLRGSRRPRPVQLLGEGFNRLLNITLALDDASGGLLLVDEIENGLHHSIQQGLFAAILNAAREYNVQIFATTHSGECIRAAYRAFGDDSRIFNYYRLEEMDDAVKAVHYTSEMIKSIIKFNMEIR